MKRRYKKVKIQVINIIHGEMVGIALDTGKQSMIPVSNYSTSNTEVEAIKCKALYNLSRKEIPKELLTKFIEEDPATCFPDSDTVVFVVDKSYTRSANVFYDFVKCGSTRSYHSFKNDCRRRKYQIRRK